MLHLEPLWREPEGEVETGVIPLSSRDKQAGGCAPCEFREAAFYQSSVGAEFGHTQVRQYHGRNYYLGDSVNAAGA